MCLRARAPSCVCVNSPLARSPRPYRSHTRTGIYNTIYNSVSRCLRRLLLCGKYRSCVQPLVSSPSLLPLLWSHSPPSTLQQCRGRAPTALDRNSPRAGKLHPSRRRQSSGGGQTWTDCTRAKKWVKCIYSELEKINARTKFSCPNRFLHEPAPIRVGIII